MKSPTSDPNLSKRHSTRSFKPCIIDEQILNSILEAGRLAPSSKNRQPWRFLVINNPKHIQELSDTLIKEFNTSPHAGQQPPYVTALESFEAMKNASCIIFVEYDKHSCAGLPSGNLSDTELVDVLSLGACVENMLIEATANDLSSLWMCDIFYCGEFLKRFLGTDGDVISCILLGKTDGSPWKRIRRPLEDITVRL